MRVILRTDCNSDFQIRRGNVEGTKERLKQFDLVVSKLRDTYERKNTDYGNSFEESLDEFGGIAFVVRADDKMRTGELPTLLKHR